MVLQWSMASSFGWGVYGLNVGLNWAADADVAPVFSMPIDERAIVLDPLRSRVLAPVLAQSHAFVEQLEPHAGKNVRIAAPVVHALGNGAVGSTSAHGVALTGERALGVTFFEDTHFDSAARERAARYELIVTGSTWNREVLDRNGIGPSIAVLQGVDTTLFHPAARSGLHADRFLVFSGGKLEHRKGQDLVLLAFKAFASRHPEALLVTAWHSPWPQVARSFATAKSKVAPVPFDERGAADVTAWAAANGVAPGQVVDLGGVPNMSMPGILREADVALFPNRAEGGTNLVAMECMACGVPTILSANTGHLDLIGEARCIALSRQRPVPPNDEMRGTEGWGESDVDEIVEALERVWRDRSGSAAIGTGGARFMAGLSWANQTRKLKEKLLPYLQ